MSKYYKTRYTFDQGRHKVWKAITEFIQKYIDKENDVVLDLGCGYCDFINNINCKKKYAVDINKESINYCNKDVFFFPLSITNLSKIKSKSISVIFASNLLEHFSDEQLEKILHEIKRVLKKRSRIIILQPNYRFAFKQYFDDYTHKKVFSDVSIVDFFKSHGFLPIKIYAKFLPFTLKSMLPKSYLLTKLYLWSFYKPFAKQMLVVFDSE